MVDGGCLWTETIWIDPGDRLTDATLRAVVSHNEVRSAICGAPDPQADPTSTEPATAR